MNLSAVPVVFYHSVKYKIKNDWVHPHIILPLKTFERHIKLFSFLKVKTFFMDDLYYHLKGDKKLPINSMVINFDDGYLDNFIFAYPLLKRYKLKATIWVNPDFVDENNNRIRPTLDDYWNGKIRLDELNQYDGFLNWEEMRLMERSGLIDIQSHTMTHTKYPISDKIVDFVSPGNKIDWLYWNLFPEDKPNFFTNPRNKIPLGYPIYESQKGNIAIKCEETGGLSQEIINYVRQNGNEKFFENKEWKKQLFSLAESLKKNNNNLYKKETEEEYISRIKEELSESKMIIEKRLGKQVNHVCWPFGGWNQITVELAEECGYLTSTVRGQKNIYKKQMYKRVDRIALDNPKYQNQLFYLYAIYKLLVYKF
ncbi:MAG: hypothetical protein A3K31_00135 [Ignavibacteria bacterium RIFOXYA12_FULL_35_25]|nr:MAG: hypothetical protein A2X60_13435 [Ignavibacteria bacterium GWF2_35_20]OGU79780.1 MAG: hypothetical protein A2254_17000 [Ignavibacteria bacterium RIFOXYA2_FULL_35_9]OGU90542.1 MAG: hypothetical protein A3K31_00135 [Ignavibacteria bacterium RIFOXYA12_FULL_35_25]OGV30909.1 MAG: hypothetical protein A2523_07975 [Ignavibacteria bacterium RIFOXYD12_FULL_36_8]